LVRLPFWLSTWIFAAVSGLLVRRWAKPSGPGDEGDRLGEIMVRLQVLQSEQETLLNEMRTLLKHD
jgi:hypothetical protein